MSRGSLLKDTAHLWLLGSALVVGGLGFIVLRGWMTPASYGEKGPYRAEALQQIAARPSVVPADSVCLECHSKVGEERAESLHKVVRCWHCHGLGTEHVREARLAAKTAGAKPPAAQPWDGDFQTTIDLFVTKDRRTCLVCHESAIGMPANFKKIVVAQHLEDMGAENASSPDVCFECHAGHDTAAK
jgi:hypothetical protein